MFLSLFIYEVREIVDNHFKHKFGWLNTGKKFVNPFHIDHYIVYWRKQGLMTGKKDSL